MIPLGLLMRRLSPSIIMLGILLLACLTRIYHIGLQSLWIDEGFTWNFARYHDPMLILRQDVHPPLYFLAVRLWVMLTGESEVAMRFFSVLPSVMSVAVIYQVGRELNRHRGSDDRWLPLLGAFLMALSDAENALSQEMRGYTWQVLFVTLSMWGFLRWSRTRQRGVWGLWVFSAVAGIYTFYLAAFTGIVQGLYALIFFRQRQRWVAFATLILIASTLLPWLALNAGDQSQNISHAEWIRPTLFFLQDFQVRFFSQQWALMIGLLILGLITVTAHQQTTFRLHPTAILLLLWFGVPLLLTLAWNQLSPVYQPHRITQIVPPLVLLTALGLVSIPQPARTFLVLVITIYAVNQVDFWRAKPLWRQMVQNTAPIIAPSLPILFEVGGDDYGPRYQYGWQLPHDFDALLDEGEPDPQDNLLIGLTTWRNLEPETYQSGLPAFIDSQRHIWLLYWSTDNGALYWLDQFGFMRTGTFPSGFNPDITLQRFDRIPETALATFENGMVLRDAQFYPNQLADLLWSVTQPLGADYTTSAGLLNEAGQLVAQWDSYPQRNQRPTSTWSLDEVVYDPKTIQTPTGESLPMGNYQAIVSVYLNSAEGLIPVLTDTGDSFIQLGTVSIQPN